MRFRVLAVLLIAAVAAVASACGGEGENGEGGGAPVTVTVVEEQGDASDEEANGSSDGGDIEVPDVVGIDHQLAQDTMQAAGLYNLTEEDATGQGRMLLWDRNWTVVEQEPAAGAMVNEDQTIILRSKKDDE